jgi:diacylglycerol kinase (ATP)
MPSHKIIANPTAGAGAGARAVLHLEELLAERGVPFDLVCTAEPWHAADLAHEAVEDGYDTVVSLGGDGTANEVLNGLMRARQDGAGSSALGVLSVGTGNDFAYGVDAPIGLQEGCKALAEGNRRTIDVGHVVGGLYPQGRYFGNGVGVGFDAAAGFEASRLTKLRGFLRYLVAVLRTIFFYYKAPTVRIEYDGSSLTQPSLMVSVMNGRRLGGGFLVAPEAEADDGLFDLCIAREVSRGRIFALIPHFLRGTQATQEPISTARASHVAITALKGSLPAHADGETLCTEGDRLELELLPRQLEIVCRAPEAAK